MAYATPEKRTVEDQHQGAVTVANTVAKPLDKTRPMQTAVECPSSTQAATDGPGRRAHSYGSDAPRSKRVSVACPIGRSTPGTHGHSRTARYTSSPAYRQADPLRKPTFQAGGAVLLCSIVSAESAVSRPSRSAVASRALTRRPRPEGWQLSRRTGGGAGHGDRCRPDEVAPCH